VAKAGGSACRQASRTATARRAVGASRPGTTRYQVISGLLQTPDYGRVHLSTSLPPDRVERELAIRFKRQKILSALVAAWFVLDESVLRRVYGSRGLMAAHLRHFEQTALLPSIGIQVMPFSVTDHPGSDGQIRLIEYADKPAVLLTEGRGSGKRWRATRRRSWSATRPTATA
jgi:hypothetical protein